MPAHAEPMPEEVDTDPRPEDGDQDVDQQPALEEVEAAGDPSLADPAVREGEPR